MTTKKAASAKKEVAVTSASALPAEMMGMLEEDSGIGLGDMGADDFLIPRIGIIQSLSPQRQKAKPEYIEGAVEGQFFESVSKTLYSGETGIVVIPVAYQPAYLEWKDREKGGGLVKNHGDDATLFNNTKQNEKGKRVTPEGNIIQRTAQYFVMLQNENGTFTKAALSMSGSFLRQAKAWNNLIHSQFVLDDEGKPAKRQNGQPMNAPIFFYSYRIKTVPITNDQGSWFGWDVSLNNTEDGKPVSVINLDNGGMGIYNEAKSFRAAIDSGAVKTSEPIDTESGSSNESDDDPM